MKIRFRSIVLASFAYLTTCLLTSSIVTAQSLSLGGSDASQQDLAAARAAVGMGGVIGAGGLGGGALGIGGMGGTAISDQKLNDADADAGKDTEKKATPAKRTPLPPNEFQKYLVAVTGNYYPMYGADFFENTQNSRANLALAPVTDDYVLGPGDQLHIRLWGATSGETSATIDRNGEIALPKVGTLKLAGIKASQAEDLIKSSFARYYKDFRLSVALGKLRKITVFVVGQSRYPGSYTLSSQATLTSGLFASGGPKANGSVRRIQLKRKGTVVAEFDLYAFLSQGDKTADVKLLDGDVISFPPASGFIALIGKVNSPAVYELRGADDNLGDFMTLSGGLPVVADPRRITLEHLLPGENQPRRIEEFSLDAQGLKKNLKNGDIVSVSPIIPELSNAVSLRGNVAQPVRLAWRQGMRISDLITSKAVLVSPDSVRRQNEVLFDNFQEERAARYRNRVPSDLVIERNYEQEDRDTKIYTEKLLAKPADSGDPTKLKLDTSLFREQLAQSLPDPSKNPINGSLSAADRLVDRIGNLVDEVNMDYAVVERIRRDDLSVSVIPFNLGRVLSDPNDTGNNQLLEPGDVITVFSVKDIRVPQARLRAFVRIEGEVNRPGVYPIMPGETMSSLIKKAGGITPDAYLYGMGFYREEVKKTQVDNLEKLLRRLESETSSSLAKVSQSLGATSDTSFAQAKIQSIEQARRQSLERAHSIRPEGRIALSLPISLYNDLDSLPALRLNNGDRIYIPPRPDFVYIFGSVNTESALLYKKNLRVSDYLQIAGLSSGADHDGVILIRADGSAFTSQSFWHNEVLGTQVMPGDTIVMPEKLDRESAWSTIVRNTKDITQIMYQLGLGAAAIHTLRQ